MLTLISILFFWKGFMLESEMRISGRISMPASPATDLDVVLSM